MSDAKPLMEPEKNEKWDAQMRDFPIRSCGRLDMSTTMPEEVTLGRVTSDRVRYIYFEDGSECVVLGKLCDFVAYRAARYDAEIERLTEELEHVCDGVPTAEEYSAALAERDEAREEVASLTATLSMTVARLGGEVEGAPTARHNFLQRIDRLREKERQLVSLDEATDPMTMALLGSAMNEAQIEADEMREQRDAALAAQRKAEARVRELEGLLSEVPPEYDPKHFRTVKAEKARHYARGYKTAGARLYQAEARVRELEGALRELDARHYLGCILEEPCGDCTTCRARAALAAGKEGE